MFVRYFVELPARMEAVERALLEAPPDWLRPMAVDAERRGEALLADVGIGPLGPRLGKQVTIELLPPVRLSSKTSVPITWTPSRTGGLLPTLEGDLEIGSLGQDATQLGIIGRYRPPLGLVGRAIDRAVLHRVAEGTVKDFMDRLARALEAQLATEQATH